MTISSQAYVMSALFPDEHPAAAVLRRVEQPPQAVVRQIAAVADKTREAVRRLPLTKVHRPGDRPALDVLVGLPPVRLDWPFFSLIDPEQAGVPCEDERSEILLRPELFVVFEDESYPVAELLQELRDWRRTICVYWASWIINHTLTDRQTWRALFPWLLNHPFTIGTSPLGCDLGLSGHAESTLRDFREECQTAMNGLKTAETGATATLMHLLQQTTLEWFVKRNENVADADWLERALDRATARVDIRLVWNQVLTRYELVGRVKTVRADGYQPDTLIARLPDDLFQALFHCTNSVSAQGELDRLALTAIWQTVRRLMLPSFAPHTD